MDFYYTCFLIRAPGLLVVSEQPETDDSCLRMFNQLYLNYHTIIFRDSKENSYWIRTKSEVNSHTVLSQ